MHVEPPASASHSEDDAIPWYKKLTRYHWFVLMVAALGWLFDTMDQQLFVLARPAAMKDLVGRLRREVLYAPGSMRAGDLMVKMQASRTHMALIIDEFDATIVVPPDATVWRDGLGNIVMEIGGGS